MQCGPVATFIMALFLDDGKGSSECREIKSSALLVPLKRLGKKDSVHVPLHYLLPQSILFEDAIRTDVNEQAATCNDGGWPMGEALKLILLIDHLAMFCIFFTLWGLETERKASNGDSDICCFHLCH